MSDLLKKRILNYVKDHPDCTKDEIIEALEAEDEAFEALHGAVFGKDGFFGENSLEYGRKTKD